MVAHRTLNEIDTLRSSENPLTTALEVQERILQQAIDERSTAEAAEASSKRNARLPPRPSIFFGRAAQIDAVVDQLVRPAPEHVAILGGPGMGKTSLALTVCHDPRIGAHYKTDIHFIACDAAEGRSNVLAVIASFFGCVKGDRTAHRKAVATALRSSSPTLIVLDNFESAWDSDAARLEAEEVLGMLTGFDGVAVVVTLRGAERPHGATWSKPVLPPLLPLDLIAAKHVFLTISDASESDPDLDRLLNYVASIPLAVVLLANLAQFESCRSLVGRWNETKTSMVARGEAADRLNSLDVSIGISLEAPRMRNAPNATCLLSLLALLPDGAMDNDIPIWGSSIPLVQQSLSVLLQNALATRSDDQRIHVLAPIRQYMLTHYPPTSEIAAPLLQHYFELAEILTQLNLPSAPNVIASITQELNNMESIIRHALSHGILTRPTLTAIRRICELITHTGAGSRDLVVEGVRIARAHLPEMEELLADLLNWQGMISYGTATAGNPRELFREARAIYEHLGHEPGQIDSTLYLIQVEGFETPAEAIAQGNRMLELATRIGDHPRVVKCNRDLAIAYEDALMLEEARSCRVRALEALRANGETQSRMAGFCMFNLAKNELYIGSVREGLKLAREALEVYSGIKYSIGIGNAQCSIGAALLQQGHLSEAIEMLQASINTFAENGYGRNEAMSGMILARAQLANQNISAATVARDNAIRSIRVYSKWTWGEALILLARAQFAEYLGDDTEALLAYREFTRACSENKSPTWRDAEILHALVRLASLEPNPADARNSLILCAAFSRKVEKSWCPVALAALARLVLYRPFDDEAEVLAESLVQTAALPLLSMGFERDLGEALLSSAVLARRQGLDGLSKQRTHSAMTHLHNVSGLFEHEEMHWDQRTGLFVQDI